MYIVGLTGGIGSGKTTVADMFATLGVPIIDTDIIARELTLPDQPAFNAITEHFGQEVVLHNGHLNRARLRQLVFNQPAKRKWLEDCLHPLIFAEVKRRIETLIAPYCIVVIPLLFEIAPYPFISRTLVVDTPESLQIARVMQRDQSHPDTIKAIMDSQLQREVRLAKADDIIHNDGKVEDLLPQVAKLHQQYLKN